MLLKKIFYLRIEYHWYLIKLLNKKIKNSYDNEYLRLSGRISYHKHKASHLSFQYEILAGIRNENGVFSEIPI